MMKILRFAQDDNALSSQHIANHDENQHDRNDAEANR